ncbi:MAG TPA: hypothetical protein VGP96_01810 [Candidatus Dormibacteraeota bacterium]|jgi:hypothetical protein|nr:hypothetical protein [Candidatus Dormibacteraeota bacterium]
MRGLRGGHARSLTIAAGLGLVVLAASTAVVVAVAGHRPPAATPDTRTPVTAPTSARRPPATVRVDEGTASVTVPVGTLLDVRLHGNPADRWREPGTSSPRILQRVSASSTPDGDATGTFEAVAAGDAFILIERSATCSSGPTGGVCGAEARRIGVTVTG